MARYKLQYLEAPRGWLGEHVSISELIATLWFNTMFGGRCERDDGVKSLAAAISGYVPNEGTYLDENRHGEVVIRLSADLNYHRLKPMGWRSSAKSRLGRTSLINLEIIIFVSLQLTLFLYILDDYIVRYVSCSRCKIPASPKMLAPKRFL